MKLRNYLATLVIAISSLPSANGSTGTPVPKIGKERQLDPLPYGISGEQQIG